MVEKSDFKPTSKLFYFIDRYQKAYKNTRITYQFGNIDNKKAIQFFLDGKPIAVRFKTQKYRDTSFDISAYGGQDINSAQMQRERCMQVIVTHLFEKLGFQIEIEPKLGQLTPDVLAKRKNLDLYIELKAYHRNNICGDPEISQTMKYFEMGSRLEESSENLRVPRSILFTTSDLIKKQDSFLSHPEQNPLKHIKKFYKPKILPRSRVNTIDDFTSKMMYIHAGKKFKNNEKIGFRKMNVVFPEDINIEDLPDICFYPSKYDVLLLNAELIYDLLKNEGLSQDAHYFKLIREAKLERLVLNREILEIPD